MIVLNATNMISGSFERVGRRRSTRIVVQLGIVLALLTAPARAQQQVDMAALIEQALDQVVDFEIEDKTLPETLVIIAEKWGTPIRIGAEALQLLPYGPATRIQGARMRNVPLRQGLRKLLSPLGMRFEVVDDHLEVVPTEAVRRICRRASWNELATIQWLAELEWANRPDQVEDLRSRLQFRVDVERPAEVLFGSIERVGAGRGDEVLTVACRSHGWTWYPWGEQIAVVSTQEQVYRELQRPITIRAQRQPLAEVLAEVARQAGVGIRFSPGVIGALPREAQRDFSLLLVDTPAEQGLEVIAGVTGLGFRPKDGGIEIYQARPAPPAREGGSTVESDPVIGRVVMPSPDGLFEYEFLIRQSDLPPELGHVRQEMIDDAVEAIRSQVAPVKHDE